MNAIIIVPSQPAITCSKLTIETLEQSVKYVKLTIKTPKRHKKQHISHLVLMFLFLTLRRSLLAGIVHTSISDILRCKNVLELEELPTNITEIGKTYQKYKISKIFS